jgi:ABC-type spermidine/putrescine transport system permease subunit II
VNENGRAPLGVWIATGFVLFFLVFPTFVVVPISFSAANYLQFPPQSWSLRWYETYFGSESWMDATLLSFEIALVVMVAATVLGTAAAFALARAQFRGKSLVYGLMLSPLIIPTIITAIAAYFLFARMRLIGSPVGLMLAHTVIAIPLVVVVVLASLSGFDRRVERAALSLGATPWYALRRITLPIIAPGILTGALLAFLASFDEVVIAIFLAGSDATTLPKKMWEGVWIEITPAIAAASTFVISLTLILFAAMELLRRRSERLTARRAAEATG